MRTSEDLLTLLLPDADEARIDRARRVTNFARLFACDAQASGSPTVRVDAEQASIELERHARERVLGALEDLLRAHLHALLPADSFGWFGPMRCKHQDAWTILDEHQLGTKTPSYVPRPGEEADSVARRLIECAGPHGLDPARIALWRARLEWSAAGPAAGRRALDELTRGPHACSLRRACHVDRAAVRLDQADLRGALEVLRESERGELRGRALRLSAWCELLLDPERPSEPVPAGPEHGPLPGAMVALRPVLDGRTADLAGLPSSCSGPPAALEDVRDRKAHGACVLAVFARCAGTARAVHLSVAPGLASGVERWVSERDGAWSDSACPEHRLVLEARAVRSHARDGRAPRGALGRRSRALSLTPILDETDEVAGWVHLEHEHHLIPGTERLAALAAAWRAPVLRASRAAWGGASHEPDVLVHEAVELEGFAEPDAGAGEAEEARILRELVRDLGWKTSHRRWWGFTTPGGTPRLVARGGSGFGRRGTLAGEGSEEHEPGGGARALRRAMATGGVVHFAGPEPGLAVHADAASGLVLPVALGSRTLGLIAVESERRRDFRSLDLERARELAASRALALRAAGFGAWHGRRFGARVMFPSSGSDFAEFTARLIAIGRAHEPLVLCGPSGSGKRVLARWVHFESEPDGPWREEEERLGASDLEALLRHSRGTLLLHGIEALDAQAQRELLRHIESPRGRAPRLVIGARRSLADSVERGLLQHNLGTRLERLQVFVPPLADRRCEIPALVGFLARRMAAENRVEPPVFEDDALALLWRQPWEGNLRSLENVVFKLVLHAEGHALDAGSVRGLLRPYGVELAARLPSRSPRLVDLLAALATTRKATGRLNKRRAALYLGWDPDTLVARMQDAELAEDPPEPEVWGVRDSGSVPHGAQPTKRSRRQCACRRLPAFTRRPVPFPWPPRARIRSGEHCCSKAPKRRNRGSAEWPIPKFLQR